MNVISDRLAHEYPEEDKGWGAVVTPLRDYLVDDVRPALLTLLGAVGFVLLIACANTANLVLARTIARRKEFAIRAALGGGSLQILRPSPDGDRDSCAVGRSFGTVSGRAPARSW